MVIFLLVFGFGRVWPKTGLGIILPGGVQSWSSFWSLWRSSLLIGCLWRWPPMTQSTRLTPLVSHRTGWLSSWYRWISTWSGSAKAGFTTTGFLIPVIAEIFSLQPCYVLPGIRDRYHPESLGLSSWFLEISDILPEYWLFMTLIAMLNILL